MSACLSNFPALLHRTNSQSKNNLAVVTFPHWKHDIFSFRRISLWKPNTFNFYDQTHTNLQRVFRSKSLQLQGTHVICTRSANVGITCLVELIVRPWRQANVQKTQECPQDIRVSWDIPMGVFFAPLLNRSRRLSSSVSFQSASLERKSHFTFCTSTSIIPSPRVIGHFVLSKNSKD